MSRREARSRSSAAQCLILRAAPARMRIQRCWTSESDPQRRQRQLATGACGKRTHRHAKLSTRKSRTARGQRCLNSRCTSSRVSSSNCSGQRAALVQTVTQLLRVTANARLRKLCHQHQHQRVRRSLGNRASQAPSLLRVLLVQTACIQRGRCSRDRRLSRRQYNAAPQTAETSQQLCSVRAQTHSRRSRQRRLQRFSSKQTRSSISKRTRRSSGCVHLVRNRRASSNNSNSSGRALLARRLRVRVRHRCSGTTRTVTVTSQRSSVAHVLRRQVSAAAWLTRYCMPCRYFIN